MSDVVCVCGMFCVSDVVCGMLCERCCREEEEGGRRRSEEAEELGGAAKKQEPHTTMWGTSASLVETSALLVVTRS